VDFRSPLPLVTILAIKLRAYWFTGSVGLLSDAVEAVVNIAAALVALAVLTYSAAKPDREHNFATRRRSTSRAASRAR
jgi:divalent metal cation (Fe/Co/Zn/Cd) transporter